MSGPKRADVEAQLNVVRDAQRRCQSRMSKMQAAVAASLAEQAHTAAGNADAAAGDAMARLAALSHEEARSVREGLDEVMTATRAARELAEQARRGAEVARTEGRAADEAQAVANRAFAEASAAYEAAVQATRSAGSHYLHGEMAQAQAARRAFEQVDEVVRRAEEARKRSAQAAESARRLAGEAKAAASAARDRVSALRGEAQERIRAEESAHRIAEQRQREARQAVEAVRAAVRRLDALPHARFRPGAGAALVSAAEEAELALQSGRLDDARLCCDGLPDRVAALVVEVEALAQREAALQAAAETEIAAAEAALADVDATLVRDWSSCEGRLADGRTSLLNASRALAAGELEAAQASAARARADFEAAMRSGAENLANHEKRASVGDAIMDVLGELGYDVSFEAGARDEPLRISGQTSDETGRGDFDLEVPLSGEIDFEVSAPAGDNSCVAAIEALRQRLAERGVAWTTTDWGQAESSAAAAPRQATTVRVRGVQKIKQKGGSTV